MSYSYESSYSNYETARTRRSPPLWLLILILVFVAIFEFFKRICRVERELRQAQEVQSLPRTQSAPSLTIMSEISNRRAATRLAQNETYRFTDTDFAPIPDSQPISNGSSHVQPQPSAPSRAPPTRTDSIPQYESPPNYDEALKLQNLNQQQKNRDTPIT